MNLKFTFVKVIAFVCLWMIAIPNARAGSFVVNGTAYQAGYNWYVLTQPYNNQAGFVWYDTYMLLNYDFDMTFEIYLGDRDGGADGIAFVMQPNSTGSGAAGGGIGYAGILPSIAVEYDTWQNDDPTWDHIAVHRNGNVYYSGVVAGPVPAHASGTGYNIENGIWHTTRLTWDASTHTLVVYFDGAYRLSYTYDIVSYPFGGNPKVYWGWTGATGAERNLQQFRVISMSFQEVLTVNVTKTDVTCFGANDGTATAIPVMGEPPYTFNGWYVGGAWISNANPITNLAPGTYTAKYTDASGYAATKSVTINQPPAVTFTYVVQNQCSDGSLADITLTPTGGFSPWQYSADGGVTYQTSGVFYGLAAGDHYLRVKDAHGCESALSMATVVAIPTLTLTSEGSITTLGCNGTVTLNLSGGVPPYTWTGGDPVTENLCPGDYTYSVVDAAGCSVFTTATVLEGIPPDITCPADIVLYTDADHCSAIATYEATATGFPVPEITYDIPPGSEFTVGTATVTATATNIVGSESCTFTVTVIDLIPPTVLTQDVDVVLAGGMATVTAAQIDAGSYDACGILDMVVEPYTFNCGNIGYNSVVLTVTDVNYNVAYGTAFVNVIGYIPACSITAVPGAGPYTAGPPTTIYLGYGPQTVTLASTVSGGSGFTYSWSGLSPALLSCTDCASPVFTPVMEGNYLYTLTVTNDNGCTTTCDIVICVLDVRVPGTSGKKVYLCHVPPGNPNNPQTLSISINGVPGHLLNHPGDQLGRCDQSCDNLQFKTGGAEGELITSEYTEFDVILYPNPFTNEITLTIESELEDQGIVIIYDLTGKVISKNENVAPDEPFIFGADLTEGMYIAVIRQGDQVQKVRIVKTN